MYSVCSHTFLKPILTTVLGEVDPLHHVSWIIGLHNSSISCAEMDKPVLPASWFLPTCSIVRLLGHLSPTHALRLLLPYSRIWHQVILCFDLTLSPSLCLISEICILSPVLSPSRLSWIWNPILLLEAAPSPYPTVPKLEAILGKRLMTDFPAV